MVKDCTLVTKFKEAVQSLYPSTHEEVINQVHGALLSKMYNARCNEFVRSITKLSCIKNNRAVDVNIGLRDQLKCYAARKETLDMDCH